MSQPSSAPRDPVVDQAVRLFEFLGRAQQLKNKPTHTLDAYGAVFWFAELPDHPSIHSAGRGGDPPAGEALLTVDRVPRLDPPEPDEALTPWLDGRLDDPDEPPVLRESIVAANDSDEEPSQWLEIRDHPTVRDLYDDWLSDWQKWAQQELRDQPARRYYGDLFSTYVTATAHTEELELVAALGCLVWTPPSHLPVRRHLLTTSVAIHFDDSSGRLTVVQVDAVDGFTVELDMLDPELTNSPHINQIRPLARSLEAHPLHREEVGSIARRLVHTLDAGGQYLDQDVAPAESTHAVVAFAPALILRKRSQQGLVDIYRTIVEQLEVAGVVPDGVIPLIDPDHRPHAAGDTTPGAVVTVDDELYLPLPVNEVQRRIVQQVDRQAQTLVQGPPGTGKTHTAAALLSHLLAQGKRVLVTAHTDRALKEVRDKLPAEIKPLSVAIVGSSREDMSDLKVAVERIAAASAEHDPETAQRTIKNCLTTIDQLARHKAGLYRTLLDAREHEVCEHEHAGYRGTLSAIAQHHQSVAGQLGWLTDYMRVPSDAEPPHPEQIVEWRGYLLNADLAVDEVESRRQLVDVSAILDPAAFADLVEAERTAVAADERLATLRTHAAFAAMSRLDSDTRIDLKRRLDQFIGEASELARRREAWMTQALSDVLADRSGIWQSRGQQIGGLIRQAEALITRLGPTTDIAVTQGNVPVLMALATDLHRYLDGGGKLKVRPGAIPKVGSLTTKVVKQAQPLFDQVRVNGLPPTTSASLDAFLIWCEAMRLVDALDRAWPDNVIIPVEDTLTERLQWHVTEHKQLQRLLRLGERVVIEDQHLAGLGLPKPDWSSHSAIQQYTHVIDAAATREIRITTEQPLHRLQQAIASAARWTEGGPCVHELLDAVRHRDHNGYATAYRRLLRLHEVRELATRRDLLSARISAAVPSLFTAIASDPAAPEWNDRLGTFTDAWNWASTSTWIREQSDLDINTVQLEITDTEHRIRRQVETLAATRAWNHAVSPDRLGGQARADLEQYAQLVRKLGKGTGTHAAKRKADIKRSMDRCRPAVPVWIMPIYRIAEQLRIQPNMFDIVIVDEASQAGLEATFLQYLAPKMVVIGDDKQVSPTAIGIDHQQLRDLAAQYLADDRYRDSWQDPTRSLFDEAKMRFGGRLVLTEHRRCVPEIIGFSNRIAYEPDGIRLIPVRQYGADRLEPIKTVFLQDGYTRGTTNKVNPVEVEALVDQIEKCIADPRYDGLTFGVISLLGTAQANVIEKALLDRVPPEEWRARDLRCGDSADFQGSERDVMFLSMVAAPEPGKRLATLTTEVYVQRYNVAASRAKDQMWLFHSVALSDVGNPDGMRFQLLDYCYGVINRRAAGEDGALIEVVPNDRLVDPFDSLFEQRVFNRLVDRGYSVIPQFPSVGYLLDLVVVGAKTRLAIECDGDTWHGPDAYERDLGRQRDLERCGWTMFRIRESAFYVDQPAVLAELWRTLDELDIHPSGWVPDEPIQAPELTVDLSPDLSAEGSAAPAADITTEEPTEKNAVPIAHMAPENPADQRLVEDTELIIPAIGAGTALAPYDEFTGSVPAALEVTTRELVEGLRAIVAVEGPVIGQRLHSAYVRASGGQRVGKLIANALNRAVTSAVRSGVLIEDNPLGVQGIRPRTYRLVDQPSVRIRRLGPRLFEEIPPAELAALLSQTAASTGWDDEETLYRTTLGLLGLKRLTANVRDQLRQASKLVTRPG